MAILEAKNLKKYYGATRALDGVTVNIDSSELLAVIGPSGSGKTTLLRSVAGFVQLDEGQILIKSKDVTHLPPEKRNVAMFFQNYALWPHMTVFENIAYGLKLRKMNKVKIKEKVDWALDFLDIRGLENRKPSQLSGGQQQRVALARAIVVEPDVLLLDEPLSNLDAKIRMRIRFELKALQQKLKVPTLYVTHDQEEALSIADRVVMMHNGKILQVGTPEEVYRHPANLFVADFIGINSILRIPLKSQNVLRIGNLETTVQSEKDIAHVVIRAEEAQISRQMKTPEKDSLLLEGTVSSKLYLGSKYRFEIKVEGIDDLLFINHDQDFKIGESVYISVPKGSYFIYGN